MTMTHVRKLAPPCNLKWVFSFCLENCLDSSLDLPNGYHPKAPLSSTIRNFGYQILMQTKKTFFSNSNFPMRTQYFNGLRAFCSVRTVQDRQTSIHSTRIIAEVQSALFDYLQFTRGIYFTDAEQISRNCPIFVGRLLEKVKDKEDIGKEISRILRYHPINEFEPFFESIGLKPSQYNSLLPRDLMFLSDAGELLGNYSELCNYGIACDKIGKIYRDASEIFKYMPGILKSKFMAYEKLDLKRSTIIKLVASTPSLLVADVDEDLALLLRELEEIGLPRDWIGGSLFENNTYAWGKMLVTLHFLKDMGFVEKTLRNLIVKHPGFLFDGSGKTAFMMISLLLKTGVTKREIVIMFAEFPQFQVGRYSRNLWKAFEFLMEIEMDYEDIKKIFRNHRKTLGLISLKKPKSLYTCMNVGKKRLCKIIIEDSHQLEKYALGSKVQPLPSENNNHLKSLAKKKRFLLRLGIVENSKEMKMALKAFRGKGDELQDRFDFFVKSGLDAADVLKMLKKAPHILNQKIEVLEEKLHFIHNCMGYPLNALMTFPQCVSYNIERVKLRHLMYDWLKERGKAKPALSLCSIVACSDQLFIKRFVSHHPEGLQAWENFKKALSSS